MCKKCFRVVLLISDWKGLRFECKVTDSTESQKNSLLEFLGSVKNSIQGWNVIGYWWLNVSKNIWNLRYERVRGKEYVLGLQRVKIGKFMGLYDAGQNNHKNQSKIRAKLEQKS